MPKTNKPFVITAECHDDNRAVEVSFDALKWFKKATTKQILALAECEWGGDYPADEVAIYMAKYNSSIADMFKYIELRGNIENIGFECHVESEEALAWLKENRPKVFSSIQGKLSQCLKC